MRENKVAGFLGRRIRTLRKSKNLTQEQLGEESGINYKHLGAIERGEENPSLSALQKIAKGLGIEILELFRFQHEEPYELELGVSVTFHPGTGTDFVLGDYWLFDAEYWTEMSSVSTALNRFQVDYANGMVTFFPGDAGKTVYATYEGRGSLVKAADLTQILDILIQGETVIRNVGTSAFTVRKLVGVNASGAWALVQPGPAGSIVRAVGFVKVVDEEEGEIQIFGPMDGFSSLTPNTELYLAADGGISTTPPVISGWIKQLVGRAMSSTRMFVKIDDVQANRCKFTPEGGLAVLLTNKTGAPSVKGSVVGIYGATSVDSAFGLTLADSMSPCGAVYESGVADGSECWVVVAGIAEVLLENGTGTVRTYWVRTSTTAPGRANATIGDPPGLSATHFAEIGHSLETKSGGTDVLLRVILHFN
jgi:transcriptional regulator with XRE-family HTH domain